MVITECYKQIFQLTLPIEEILLSLGNVVVSLPVFIAPDFI